MKSISKLLSLAFALTALASTASAQDYDTRVRVQVKDDSVSHVSVVGELPNLSTAPGQVLVGVGYGMSGNKYEVGVHLGGMTMPGAAATALVDVRGTVTLTDNLYSWVNLRLLGLEDTDSMRVYGFGTVNYKLPTVVSFLAVGVETEETFSTFASGDAFGKTDVSVGPSVHVHVLKGVRLEGAYQVHSELGNQAWARLNVML